MAISVLDLSAIATDVAEEVVRRAGTSVLLDVEPGMRARADERLIRLLFQNLVENSLKFARKDVPLHISIGSEKGAFFVRDNGIGFSSEHGERIFLPFERLNREEDYPGSGIGLTNVKRIVDRHDGRVWADASPGQGATFYFTLPRP